MRKPPGAGAARWRVLGRVLPRDIRERIYEPAFSDLLYGWLTARRAPRLPFGLYAIGTILGCLPIAVPRLFVRQGALTRLGRVAVGSLTTLALAVLILRLLTRTVAGY